MTKKLIIRKGDIFCAEIENEYKCYFQYIERDRTQLGSFVIRVFKTRYPITYDPIIDEIVKDDVFFYAHTLVLRLGTLEQVWTKVGTSKDVGDTENINFRLLGIHGWYVWKINEKFQTVGPLTDEIKGYDFGWAFPYKEIINKIKTGHYSDSVEHEGAEKE